MVSRLIATMTLVLTTCVAHAEVATIHLTDGSKLVGEVTSLKGDVYTIQTESMGVLSIPQSQIRVVEFVPAAGATLSTQANLDAPTIDDGMFSQLQQRMLNNPTVMSMILSLKEQPQIQALLADPEIKAAMAAGNYMSLMDHPKIKALLSNGEVQKIVSELQ